MLRQIAVRHDVNPPGDHGDRSFFQTTVTAAFFKANERDFHFFLNGFSRKKSNRMSAKFSSSSGIEIEAEIEIEDELAAAVYKFNVSPRKGIRDLCKFLNIEPTPANVAHVLNTVPDLMGERIGEYLARPENNTILVAYFQELGVKMDFIAAMRNVIQGPMRLPPEADQIDVIVGGFATAYFTENPGVFDSADTCHILAFALVMLNSDQHNPNVPKRMTCKQFVANVRGALSEQAVSTKELTKMFEAIKEEQFNYRRESPEKLMALCDPRCYGYLRKKTNRWHSVWTNRFFVLANSCLYYFEDNAHSNNGSPLGMVQLVSVSVAGDSKDPNMIVIQAASESIQFVRFRKGKPVVAKHVKKIFLQAPDEVMAKKWRYRIMQSVVLPHSQVNVNGMQREEAATPVGSSGRSEPSDEIVSKM